MRWSHHYSFLWKTIKKREKVVCESKNGFESRLCVEKVLSPQDAKDNTFHQNEE